MKFIVKVVCSEYNSVCVLLNVTFRSVSEHFNICTTFYLGTLMQWKMQMTGRHLDKMSVTKKPFVKVTVSSFSQ